MYTQLMFYSKNLSAFSNPTGIILDANEHGVSNTVTKTHSFVSNWISSEEVVKMLPNSYHLHSTTLIYPVPVFLHDEYGNVRLPASEEFDVLNEPNDSLCYRGIDLAAQTLIVLQHVEKTHSIYMVGSKPICKTIDAYAMELAKIELMISTMRDDTPVFCAVDYYAPVFVLGNEKESPALDKHNFNAEPIVIKVKYEI